MKEITPMELKKMMDSNEDFQLIDVREPWEVEESSIGGLNIPMGNVILRVDEIAKDKKVVVHCKSGMRSASVIQTLEQKLGYINLYNLKGGITAYLHEIA
jgi:rhodanese-related sulfurtransferase